MKISMIIWNMSCILLTNFMNVLLASLFVSITELSVGVTSSETKISPSHRLSSQCLLEYSKSKHEQFKNLFLTKARRRSREFDILNTWKFDVHTIPSFSGRFWMQTADLLNRSSNYPDNGDICLLMNDWKSDCSSFAILSKCLEIDIIMSPRHNPRYSFIFNSKSIAKLFSSKLLKILVTTAVHNTQTQSDGK